ncbi:GmrSD restriction endonuclease domain-containing protein [Pseudomonas alloputida]|uniref:GmrSD restriction endonuclease domain-containing protein n=1 Tax=Pseudomonas alloputida TaxID=1940621 RepID=UPI00320A020B
MSEPLTIRKLIERISSGDIRIPAFQRNFVWEPDQVAFLLDSIYKGFPIGTIILWKTETRLKAEKKMGHFNLPEPQKNYPVNYVLDGQQRLTSLFSVFQTDLQPTSKEWVDVYFDMLAADNIQESLFLALDASEVDTERHFPAKALFDTVGYRKATSTFSDESILKIDELQSRFKEYLIPNEVFESDDQNKVAIVFERINRAGTDLNVFELLSAWSWSEEFDLVEKFTLLQDAITDHGFEDLGEDRDLQLRICAGIICGETTPKRILELKGEEIRSRFNEIEHGITGALDFLSRELNVKHYKMLPFPGILVPLSAFFATDKTEGKNYTSLQKEQIIRWFWRSLFSRRFSSDVNERQAHDIVEMQKLAVDENHPFKHPKPEIKFDFTKSVFSTANANSRVLILLLSNVNAYSFLSGAKIDPAKVLKKSSKHEFHHIFPQKHLAGLGKTVSEINVLANICFLTRADNNSIRAKDPKNYLNQPGQQKIAEYLESAFCPHNTADLTYEEFLAARNTLLTNQAQHLMK